MFDRKNQKLIRRIRLKAYHFCKDNLQPVNESANGYFEFKPSTTTPPNEHLNAFENDLDDLIQEVNSQIWVKKTTLHSM